MFYLLQVTILLEYVISSVLFNTNIYFYHVKVAQNSFELSLIKMLSLFCYQSYYLSATLDFTLLGTHRLAVFGV